MISRVALGLEAMAGALQAPAPVVEVGQLAVVDDGDVGERIGPIGVGVGDVDVGLRRHPRVSDRVRADVVGKPVLLRHGLGVAEVLDDLERAAERQHLGVANALDGVRQQLQVAVEAEDDGHRPQRALDLLDLGAERPHPRLDLGTLALHPGRELGALTSLVQLYVHDVGLRMTAVQREAGGVRAAVLHRLEHPRHIAPDGVFVAAVAIDDPGDPAHGTPYRRPPVASRRLNGGAARFASLRVTRAEPPGTRRAPSR